MLEWLWDETLKLEVTCFCIKWSWFFFFLLGDDEVNVEEDGKTKRTQKDDEEQIAKYRQLLQVIQEKEKKGKENDMEMEIKWVPGKN